MVRRYHEEERRRDGWMMGATMRPEERKKLGVGDDASAPVAREPPRRSFRTRRRTLFHRHHKATRVYVAKAAVRRARTAPGPSSRVSAPSRRRPSVFVRRASLAASLVVPSRHPPWFPLHSSSLSSVSSSLPSSSSGPSSPPSSAKGLRHAGHWNASPPMSRSRP